MTRLLPAFLVLVAGCGSDAYVSLMDGAWAGTATDLAGAGSVMTGNLIWSDQPVVAGFEGPYIRGTVDLQGWTYEVYSAASDNQYAQMEMFHNAGARKLDLTDVSIDADVGTMGGTWSVNTCYTDRVPQPEQDPALCNASGTFTMTRSGPPVVVGATPPPVAP